MHNLYYIYFVVKPLEDPKKITDIIVEALRNTGQRGIIDRGWGNLGSCKYFPSDFCSTCFSCFFENATSLQDPIVHYYIYIGLSIIIR